MSSLMDPVPSGWYNGDDNRSSWSIIWSCFATIFACTWTVLHLGIPERDVSDGGVFIRKLRLLAITAIAPEVITAYAFGELISARRLLKLLRQERLAQDHWTLSHAFFLSMGSLHLLSSDGYEIPICTPSHSEDGWEHPTCNPDLVALVKTEKLAIPNITERDIKDRSKADSFTKMFTLFQALWFVINCFARIGSRLPLSPLEISALAYIFCTAVTYACWWSKPKDVLTTFKVPVALSVDELPEEMQESINSFDPLERTACHYRWKSLRLPSTESEILGVIRQRWSALTGLVTGVIFCRIHLTAWNFAFPSTAEQRIWRYCSVASAAVPLTSFVAVFLRSLNPSRFDSLWPLVFAVYCTVMAIYTLSRLLLCVIMLTVMRNLPAKSFVAINWALRFPHM